MKRAAKDARRKGDQTRWHCLTIQDSVFGILNILQYSIPSILTWENQKRKQGATEEEFVKREQILQQWLSDCSVSCFLYLVFYIRYSVHSDLKDATLDIQSALDSVFGILTILTWSNQQSRQGGCSKKKKRLKGEATAWPARANPPAKPSQGENPQSYLQGRKPVNDMGEKQLGLMLDRKNHPKKTKTLW